MRDKFYSTYDGRDVLFAVILTAVISAFLTVSLVSVSQPICPTEDSCRVDYYNGQYHIIEVVP